jgi:hypothetical protein
VLFFIEHDIRIDRIPRVAQIRFDHFPLIDPFVAPVFVIECDVGRMPDARAIFPERRDGVVEVIFSAEEAQVRRPDSAGVGDFLRRPRRQIGSENVSRPPPGEEIVGPLDRNHPPATDQHELPLDANGRGIVNAGDIALLRSRDRRQQQDQK